MQFRFKMLTLAIVLIVVAGGVAGVWLSTTASAKVDNGAAKVAVQKTAVAEAPAVKADDADDEEVEGDDKEEENEKGEGKDDEQEVKITLEQVPEAVRTVILAAAGSAAIEEIEAETENGKTTYEAEWVAGGKEAKLKVAADGTVLKTKVKAGKHKEEQEEEDED